MTGLETLTSDCECLTLPIESVNLVFDFIVEALVGKVLLGLGHLDGHSFTFNGLGVEVPDEVVVSEV